MLPRLGNNSRPFRRRREKQERERRKNPRNWFQFNSLNRLPNLNWKGSAIAVIALFVLILAVSISSLTTGEQLFARTNAVGIAEIKEIKNTCEGLTCMFWKVEDQTPELSWKTKLVEASVTDDGLPNPPGKTTVTWTGMCVEECRGNGQVHIDDTSALEPTVSGLESGLFRMAITAFDGEKESDPSESKKPYAFITALTRYGDPNRDMKVSPADMLWVIDVAMGKKPLSGLLTPSFVAGDVRVDKKITLADYLLILDYITGKRDELPVNPKGKAL